MSKPIFKDTNENKNKFENNSDNSSESSERLSEEEHGYDENRFIIKLVFKSEGEEL